ncbi:2OG-Fe(II) oxygenase [Pseudomonas gingeri]|uniref:2OG-Fe(II) oxygenase n=1 Tax=Pseudomonas gingeri TaxID=117681 RepID=A0A7Y7XC88_9PSED|nr:2OG-Fe(II) oxygenase [Pseudomonas gingeri]NWA28934.1 2OG-Fe(II) oxygenase [Pseudomonas gingeri]NWB97253.1 2OG-Fe(II) oxygenase [Pseudomonas gingeri]NWD66209.1 2OG-Fe(II) oxygenase [Pseudomonas gingeri]NWD76457.1 2OG-Fe(II) oxygenase [Pseudomonas gingeri]
MTTCEIIDLVAIETTPVQLTPFPYSIIGNVLSERFLANVQQDFPAIEDAGSFPLASVRYGAAFAKLIDELHSDAFRQVIAEKFAIDLADKPVMITVRGKADHKDGRIHTDSKSKLITVLLYLNDEWSADEGRLRLLYDQHDLDHYAAEVPPTAGTMLLFKVAENGWHGHKTFIGARKVLQMNYVTNETVLNKHAARHRFSAKFKAWRRRFFGKNTS